MFRAGLGFRVSVCRAYWAHCSIPCRRVECRAEKSAGESENSENQGESSATRKRQSRLPDGRDGSQSATPLEGQPCRRGRRPMKRATLAKRKGWLPVAEGGG